MKKFIVIAGALLLIGAGVWRFAVAPRFEQRFPHGWVWEVNSLGLTGYADEATGQFPEGTTLADDPVNNSVRTVSADASSVFAGQVMLTDFYQSTNATTNVVEWEYTATAVVDAVTGRIVDGEFAGDYYFLPRNADPGTTYSITNTNYRSLPFTYQQDEEIGGLLTRKFSYRGDMENTAGYSYLDLPDGQSVYCFDFELDYWIEPITGEIIKYREWCEGDWVVDDATGERLYAISRWGSETTGDDLIRQVRAVRAALSTYNLNTLYIPAGAVVIGALLLGGGLLAGQLGKRNEPMKIA